MKNSHIEWTTHTFNPWIGCTKVSPGCAHCYAETLNKRWKKGANWGKGAPRDRTSEDYWSKPIAWNEEAAYAEMNHTDETNLGKDLGPYVRPRVFSASLADWLDDEVRIEWLADLLKLIHATPNLDWLLLTKRPENWSARIHLAFREDKTGDLDWLSGWLDGDAPANVWIGTTVEDQEHADKRIPRLLSIPAKVRFLSCEPLLEPVQIPEWLITHSRERARLHNNRTGHDCGAAAMTFICDACNLTTFSERPGINWVICGGESGAGARRMEVDWARGLRDQCVSAGVPFFFKQWGIGIRGDQLTFEGIQDEEAWDGEWYKMPKHEMPRELDGREWNEFPTT